MSSEDSLFVLIFMIGIGLGMYVGTQATKAEYSTCIEEMFDDH